MIRETRIVAPEALLAIPDAPPACFAHWARQAPVPQTPFFASRLGKFLDRHRLPGQAERQDQQHRSQAVQWQHVARQRARAKEIGCPKHHHAGDGGQEARLSAGDEHGAGEEDDPQRRRRAEERSEERRVGKECRSRWSPYH